MSRASYRDGVAFIAENDDAEEMDPSLVRGTLTVGLLAYLFGRSEKTVAHDVVAYRERRDKSNGAANS